MGLSHEETCELVRRARAGEAEALDELVRSNLGLITWQRKRLRLSKYSDVVLDDLFQEGVLGLMEAVKSFDPSKNVKFSVYAKHCIRRCMLLWLWNNASIIRLPLHFRPCRIAAKRERTPKRALVYESLRRRAEQTQRPMTVLADRERFFDVESPRPAGAMAEDEARLVREAVAALPDRQRDLIEMCYLQNHERLGSAKWAASRGWSEQTGKLVHRNAIRRLRQMLGAKAASLGLEVDG